MSDSQLINFNQPHELNHILRNRLGKRGTEKNREILTAIGNDYKKARKVRMISNRPDFYDFAKRHPKHRSLETLHR